LPWRRRRRRARRSVAWRGAAPAGASGGASPARAFIPRHKNAINERKSPDDSAFVLSQKLSASCFVAGNLKTTLLYLGFAALAIISVPRGNQMNDSPYVSSYTSSSSITTTFPFSEFGTYADFQISKYVRRNI